MKEMEKKRRSTFAKELDAFVHKHELAACGDRLLVAVSGGVDSMVLCWLLRELAPAWNWHMEVAHFNHHLRADESDEDERFVQRQCSAWGLMVHSDGEDVAQWSKRNGHSIESGARILRYRFFQQLAASGHFDRIVTAHNRDDQAETVLDHFLRGSGVTGLAGIPVKRHRIIRPLLFADRARIQTFADNQKIDYRVDSSNSELAFRRNRLRLQLLPQLQEQYNPQIHHALARTAENLTEVEEYLLAGAEQCLSECRMAQKDDKIILDCKLFLPYFTILKKYLLRLCLQQLAIDERILDNTLFGKVLSGFYRQIGSFYHEIDHAVFFEKCRDELIIGRVPAVAAPLTIARLGEYRLWDNWVLTVSSSVDSEHIRNNKDPQCIWIDGEKLHLPLTVRTVCNGDRFQPLNMAGSQSLADFFINQKIPRHQRRRIPLLCSGDQIVWVCGYRLDDRFKITAQSKVVYQVRLAKQREHEIGI